MLRSPRAGVPAGGGGPFDHPQIPPAGRIPEGRLDQAERISGKIGSRQLESREDLRKEFIVTIDPDDARDFDDAIQVEKTSTDWRLGVHIADLAAYVEPASALDRGARRRGNIMSLPDRVIP